MFEAAARASNTKGLQDRQGQPLVQAPERAGTGITLPGLLKATGAGAAGPPPALGCRESRDTAIKRRGPTNICCYCRVFMSNSQTKKKPFLQMVQLQEQGRGRGRVGEGFRWDMKMKHSFPKGPQPLLAGFSLWGA